MSDNSYDFLIQLHHKLLRVNENELLHFLNSDHDDELSEQDQDQVWAMVIHYRSTVVGDWLVEKGYTAAMEQEKHHYDVDSDSCIPYDVIRSS